MGTTTIQKAIKAFAQAAMENQKVYVSMQDEWASDIYCAVCRIICPKNPFTQCDEEDIAFREDFYSRCPFSERFSDIIISTLHEIGHWIHRRYTRENLDEYIEMCNKTAGDMQKYLQIPIERMATDWAIEWLSEPSNREIARDFDRQFEEIRERMA